MFLKFAIIENENGEDWKEKNEFPIDVEIGKDFKFHSYFVDPVTKQISYDEPQLLPCGHVISK